MTIQEMFKDLNKELKRFEDLYYLHGGVSPTILGIRQRLNKIKKALSEQSKDTEKPKNPKWCNRDTTCIAGFPCVVEGINCTSKSVPHEQSKAKEILNKEYCWEDLSDLDRDVSELTYDLGDEEGVLLRAVITKQEKERQ